MNEARHIPRLLNPLHFGMLLKFGHLMAEGNDLLPGLPSDQLGLGRGGLLLPPGFLNVGSPFPLDRAEVTFRFLAGLLHGVPDLVASGSLACPGSVPLASRRLRLSAEAGISGVDGLRLKLAGGLGLAGGSRRMLSRALVESGPRLS